jgi:lipopolysaccharide export system permease protein
MKKLIFSKFLSDIIKAFFLTGLSLSLIVWVIQSVNYLDLVIEDGHGFDLYLSYTLLNFPKIFSRILPILFFLTLFYKLVECEKKNELIIFWSHGISKAHFLNILIIFSISIYLFQILLGGYIAPLSQYKARSLLKNSSVDFFPSLIKEGKFIDVISGLTIFIDKKTNDGGYQNIFLTEEVGNGVKKIIYAENGYLVNKITEKAFILSDGKMINQDKNNNTFVNFEEIKFDLTKYGSKTITFPKIQETKATKLAKCLLYYYQNNLESFKEFDFRCELSMIDVIKQELLRRFYLPVYLPLIALLCGALIMKPKEDVHYDKFKYYLFFFIFSIIVFSEISLKYYFLNIYSFIVFSLFPVIVFILSYFIIIRQKKI